MKTFIRIAILGLCLAMAAPAAWAKTDDATQQSSKSKSKSDSKSKSKSDSKSKSKNGSKSKKDKEPSKGKSKKAAPAKSSGGFRDLPWGSPLSVLKEPDLREQEGDLKYYSVPGDDMDLMGAHMREIVYVFCKNKLSGVLTRYDGQINQLILLGALKDAYGTPLESPANVRGDRSWRFDQNEDSSIMMEFAESPGTGALAWMAKGQLSPCQQPAP